MRHASSLIHQSCIICIMTGQVLRDNKPLDLLNRRKVFPEAQLKGALSFAVLSRHRAARVQPRCTRFCGDRLLHRLIRDRLALLRAMPFGCTCHIFTSRTERRNALVHSFQAGGLTSPSSDLSPFCIPFIL